MHEKYMRRCLELAQMAEGNTPPNPMVGAVVVCDNRIIGEGYHHRAGQPHAEVMAIADVADKSLLKQSTIYVSLEPCSHYGKTPPCAELIIRSGIPRVVMAMRDPFPQVAGRGERMLRDASIEVVVGMLEAEARQLNRCFLTAIEQHRPYVVLKWAQTADGFMDALRNDATAPPLAISGPLRQREVHQWRQRCGAVLVGYRTALLDNPSLTVRLVPAERQPLRVVLDRADALPATLQLFDGQADTLVVVDASVTSRHKRSAHVLYLALPYHTPDFWPALMAELVARNIHGLLVEGGAQTLSNLIASGLYDAVDVEVGALTIGNGVKAPSIPHSKMIGK